MYDIRTLGKRRRVSNERDSLARPCWVLYSDVRIIKKDADEQLYAAVGGVEAQTTDGIVVEENKREAVTTAVTTHQPLTRPRPPPCACGFNANKLRRKSMFIGKEI